MQEIILKLKKNLPTPIKNILIWLYDCWGSKIILDRNMAEYLAEYFKLTYEKTICMLKLGTKLNADLWHILKPKTKEEVENFYAVSPYNIFDLAYWHMQNHQRRFRNQIIKLSYGSILDYGGGIGDLSLELFKKGFDVDYVDIKGETFNFAKWLFEKNNCKIGMLDLAEKGICRKYNTIICIDVIEHVVNPKELLKKFVDHLEKNGILIINNVTPFKVEETHPMHFEIKSDLEEYLESLELSKSEIFGWLWVKK